jgi:hypothetical protein
MSENNISEKLALTYERLAMCQIRDAITSVVDAMEGVDDVIYVSSVMVLLEEMYCEMSEEERALAEGLRDRYLELRLPAEYEENEEDNGDE